jgi:type IV secretion system protein TrbE
LRHELFRERIAEWLKTLRKNNAVVVLATQSISDIYKSTIRDVILESCPNKILLPNSEAMNSASREFYDRLGLNDREIEMIKLGTRCSDYYWISPQGRRMISLGLGEVALAFLGVNGDAKRNALRELIEAYPDNWQSKWLTACGLEDWAKYYDHLDQQNKRRVA